MRSNPVGPVRVLALLLVSTLTGAARAHDVSDELSAGALSSSGSRGSSPFLSNRIGGSLDASDVLALSLSGTFTRYFRSPGASAESILQLAAAGDYSPTDHLSFGLDIRGSPPSTATAQDAPGAARYSYRTSSLRGGRSAAHDTAGDSDAETIGDSYLGVTSYRTTQR